MRIATFLLSGLLWLLLASSAEAVEPAPPGDATGTSDAAVMPSMSVERARAELRRNEPEARIVAAEALALHAERGDRAAIAALIGLLGDAPSKLRYHAEWGLARAGADALPALLEAFAHEQDDEQRARLARAIGRAGLATRAAAPTMIAALRDPHPGTVRGAAYALGAMRSREALPALVDAYAAARWLPTQREIARVFVVIDSHQSARRAREALVASVLEDLESPDPERRAMARRYAEEHLRVVARSAPSYLPARADLAVWVPPLEAALDDASADRPTIVRALGHAGGGASAAVPALRALLGDPELAREAERALAAIATPEAKRILVRHAQLKALDKRIRREYDVFDHQGRTRLLPFYVVGGGTEGVRMELRFLYLGDEPRRPEHVVVAFESYSPEPRFEGMDEIAWLADGARVVIGDIDRTLSSSQRGVIERVSGVVPLADFERLIAASKLEAQLASLHFEVASGDRAALRHFAARIPQPAPASAQRQATEPGCPSCRPSFGTRRGRPDDGGPTR